MIILEFRSKFHWSLLLRVQLTIFQHWFRYWLGTGQATSHYLNQWLLNYQRIDVSFGLNELMLDLDCWHNNWLGMECWFTEFAWKVQLRVFLDDIVNWPYWPSSLFLSCYSCICTEKNGRALRHFQFFGWYWSKCDVTYGTLTMAAIVCWLVEADRKINKNFLVLQSCWPWTGTNFQHW